MHLPASQALVPELVVRASSPSTNAELADRARSETLPGFTTLVTDDQTAGRGRLDRSWTAPAGSALAISVLIDPGTEIARALPAGAVQLRSSRPRPAVWSSVTRVVKPGSVSERARSASSAFVDGDDARTTSSGTSA